jgi:hypothetical protein
MSQACQWMPAVRAALTCNSLKERSFSACERHKADVSCIYTQTLSRVQPALLFIARMVGMHMAVAHWGLGAQTATALTECLVLSSPTCSAGKSTNRSGCTRLYSCLSAAFSVSGCCWPAVVMCFSCKGSPHVAAWWWVASTGCLCCPVLDLWW